MPAEDLHRPAYRSLAILYASVLLVALSVTWVYLGMRAVMDIGGACAEGGPYVPVQPCPDAAAVVLPIGIPLMLLAAFAGTGVGIGLGAPNLLVPMWTFLFGSLGWNFLEYGAFTDGVVWDWVVCGVVFEAMALPGLLVMLPVGRRNWTPQVRRPDPAAGHATRQWVASYAVLSAAGVALAIWTYRAWS